MEEGFRKQPMASLMLSHSGRGNRTMNSKRGLMTVLVGLAMLATPIAAAADRTTTTMTAHGQTSPPTVVARHNFRNGTVLRAGRDDGT